LAKELISTNLKTILKKENTILLAINNSCVASPFELGRDFGTGQ